MRRDDVIVALALAAAGLFTIAVVIPRYVAGGAVGGGLSPAFMPYVAAGLATLAALGMLVGALRERDASARTASARGASARTDRFTRADAKFLAASAVVLGVPFALMEAFGYVVGGIALTAGVLALARVKPVPLAVAAVAAPIALWLFFVVLLDTPLP